MREPTRTIITRKEIAQDLLRKNRKDLIFAVSLLPFLMLLGLFLSLFFLPPWPRFDLIFFISVFFLILWLLEVFFAFRRLYLALRNRMRCKRGEYEIDRAFLTKKEFKFRLPFSWSPRFDFTFAHRIRYRYSLTVYSFYFGEYGRVDVNSRDYGKLYHEISCPYYLVRYKNSKGIELFYPERTCRFRDDQ